MVHLAPPFHIQLHIPTALLPESCGCSSMVEHQPSKLDTWVRFPSPAFVTTTKTRFPMEPGFLVVVKKRVISPLSVTDTKNKLPMELVFLVSVKKRVIAPASGF